MSTIPISQITSIVKGVINGGGAASSLGGLILTQDTSIPPGQVKSFFSADTATAWFGASAPEALAATAYFPGIVGGGQLPYELKFARFATAAAPAVVYGAQLGALTLAQLKALSGTLTVTTSSTKTSSNIVLTAATDFANAATLMTAGFTSPDFAITYDAARARFLLSTNASGTAATVSAVTGTLADGVGLSTLAGAFVQAAGVAADSPASAMSRAVSLDANWGVFTTAWLPAIDVRTAFSAWTSTQNLEFLYAAYDKDGAGLTPNNPAAFGSLVFAQPYQGTWPIYGTIETVASLALGYAASINFNVREGRTTSFLRQSAAGVATTIDNRDNAEALLSNKYTYYGAYANAANAYSAFNDGKVSGQYLWSDTYLDQIYLNRELQRAEFEAMQAYNSLPYNSDGYERLYIAAKVVALAAVTSGIIRIGVTLDANQIAQINTQAGRDVASALQTQGWYYLIGDPANVAQARQNRTSPSAQFWWCDGGSIQKLTVNSRAVI